MLSKDARSKLMKIREQLVSQLGAVDDILNCGDEPSSCNNCACLTEKVFCTRWEAYPPGDKLDEGCHEFIPHIPF